MVIHYSKWSKSVQHVAIHFSRVNFSGGLFCWKKQNQKVRLENSGFQNSGVQNSFPRIRCPPGICWAAVRIFFVIFGAFLGSARVEDTNRERHLAPERCPRACFVTGNACCVSDTSSFAGHFLSQLRRPQHQPARPVSATAKSCQKEEHWEVGLGNGHPGVHPWFFESRGGLTGKYSGRIRGGFWGGFFGEDFLGRIFLSLSLRSPCQKILKKKLKKKSTWKAALKSARKKSKIRTKIRTQNPHEESAQKSAHKNPHTKVRIQESARHRDAQRSFPPDLPQRKTWP